MEIDSAVDILVLLFWLVIGVVSTTFCYGVVARNMSNFTLHDKSAVTAAVDNTPEKYRWTTRDYILMLAIADEYCPEPKSVDIKFIGVNKDTLVTFDGDYLVNMEGRLQKYYIENLDGNVDRQLDSMEYYSVQGEKSRWRFKEWRPQPETTGS